MKNILILITLYFFGYNYSQPPQGYYDDAQGLTGYQLKTALKTIIDDIDNGNGQPFHTPQAYSDLDLAYPMPNSGFRDEYSFYENDGFLLDIYSENPNGSDPYNHVLVTDECGNYNAEGVCYNKEHLLPQSFFNQQSPMRGDIHYVFPTDGQVNGYRSNFPFGEVNNPNLMTQNGSRRGPNVFPGYSGTVFEPLDEFKGDIARGLFYFATRYEDQVNTGGWDNANDNILNANKNQFYDSWYVDLLLSWHLLDPVSPEELDRNNNGFMHQNNRNPFIDNPIYVQAIWDDTFSIDAFDDLQVDVFPNPIASNTLSVKVDGANSYLLEAYSLLGRRVLKRKVSNSNSLEVSIDNWSKGVYLLRITTGNASKTIKLIRK